MDLKWDYQLKADQRPCPVVHAEHVNLDGIFVPTDEDLLKIFTSPAFTLQTWGRSVDRKGKTILTYDPHWIAVRKSTPLHYDPKYPRYTHHLKLRVDPGIVCRGLNKEELELKRGLFYVLDTHSPHQVLAKDPESPGWNVSVSMDMHEVSSDMPATIAALLHYARTASFVTEAEAERRKQGVKK